MDRPTGDGPTESDRKARKLARRGSASLIGSAVTAVAQLALTVVVARTVQRQGAGLFFSATSLFLLLATAARLGTPTGLVWALSHQRVQGGSALIRPTIRSATTAVAAMGVVVALALLLLAGPVAHLLLPSSATPKTVGQMASLLRADGAFVPIAAVYDATCAATRGLGVMWPTVVVERVIRPTIQCLLVAVAAVSASLTWLTVGWVVPYLAALVLVLWVRRRVLRQVAPWPANVAEPEQTRAGVIPASGPSAENQISTTLRAFWIFTAPRALANIFQIALQRLDIVLVGALKGPQDAAIYAAATRFLVLGQAAALAISLAVEPNLGEELGTNDRRGALFVYRMATAWLMIVTWPIYLFAFITPDLILSVFGHGYGAGAVVIRVLAAAMLVATGCGMVDMVLNMAGRSLWNLGNVALGTTVFVVLDLLLIPPFGIKGAAIGWAVAILVNNLLPLSQIGLSLRLHPFGRATALVGVWAAVSCGVLPGLVLLGRTTPAWLTLLALLGSLLVYAAGLYRLRKPLALHHLPVPGRRRKRLAAAL